MIAFQNADRKRPLNFWRPFISCVIGFGSFFRFVQRLRHIYTPKRKQAFVACVELFVMVRINVTSSSPSTSRRLLLLAAKLRACAVKLPSATSKPYSFCETFPYRAETTGSPMLPSVLLTCTLMKRQTEIRSTCNTMLLRVQKCYSRHYSSTVMTLPLVIHSFRQRDHFFKFIWYLRSCVHVRQ